MFSFRENFQFPPAGGPRIRKLNIFGETEKPEKTEKTDKTDKTDKFLLHFRLMSLKEMGRKFSVFSVYSALRILALKTLHWRLCTPHKRVCSDSALCTDEENDNLRPSISAFLNRDSGTLRWRLWYSAFCIGDSSILHSALCNGHSGTPRKTLALSTLYSALMTGTLHSPFYILHSTLSTIHSTLHFPSVRSLHAASVVVVFAEILAC